MKYVISFIALFVVVNTSFSQNRKEDEFVSALKNVVSALVNRDSLKLSKYTDRGTGVYILNRIGVMNMYKHVVALGFSDQGYPNSPFYDGVKPTPLIYSTLPTFDCEQWSGMGTFVDTTRVDRLLSKIVADYNSEFDDKIPQLTIDKISSLESSSRRVVIAANDGNELIIYLSYLHKKWYLTMIDKVTADCSS